MARTGSSGEQEINFFSWDSVPDFMMKPVEGLQCDPLPRSVPSSNAVTKRSLVSGGWQVLSASGSVVEA